MYDILADHIGFTLTLIKSEIFGLSEQQNQFWKPYCACDTLVLMDSGHLHKLNLFHFNIYMEKIISFLLHAFLGHFYICWGRYTLGLSILMR